MTIITNKPTLETMPLDLPVGGDNVRFSDKAMDLVPSILEDGLHTPILVSRRENNKTRPVIILRGHRRWWALDYIRTNMPDRFLALFPNGEIPVEVHDGLTDQEEAGLLVDHDTRPLTKNEMRIAGCRLMKAGFKPAQVANRLAQMLDAYNPLSPTKQAKLNQIRADEGHEAYWKAYAAERSNDVQRIAELHQAPDWLLDILRYEDTHELPSWADSGEDIPKLTVKRIRECRDAFKADQKKSPRTYTKATGSPTSLALRKKWLAEDEEKSGTTRAKAMSAKDMMNLADECQSLSIRNIILYLAGQVDAETADIAATDLTMAHWDLLMQDYAEHDQILDAVTEAGSEALSEHQAKIQAQIEADAAAMAE